RTALANGESKWLTGIAARQDVQQFRAQSSAILSTAATVIADNPALTVRQTDLPEKVLQHYADKTVRQPLRVIIDSQARLTPHYQMMRDEPATLLVSGKAYQHSFAPSVSTLILPLVKQHIALDTLLTALGQRQINNLWVEAGAKLAGALIMHKLVDELIIY